MRHQKESEIALILQTDLLLACTPAGLYYVSSQGNSSLGEVLPSLSCSTIVWTEDLFTAMCFLKQNYIHFTSSPLSFFFPNMLKQLNFQAMLLAQRQNDFSEGFQRSQKDIDDSDISRE